MEIITKYKALDGKEFKSRVDCADYEALISKVNDIISRLQPRPNDTDFVNGSGFIQQEKHEVNGAKIMLLNIFKNYTNHHWVQQNLDDLSVHPSWVHRLLSDHGLDPLSNAWYRFLCIENSFREWGQPYFVKNPESATNICLT